MAAKKTVAMPQGSIVIVDDEVNMVTILARILQVEGYTVRAFSKPDEALDAILKDPPDLVMTDIRMPVMTGIELLRAVKQHDPKIAVVLLTAFSSVETAVEAMQLGANDYVTKPFQTDELLARVRRALEHRTLLEEVTALSAHVSREAAEINIIGGSAAIHEIRERIGKIGPTDSNVLIFGDSGTGKELVAQAIHRASPRAKQRFVPINCASIPELLLESELFGYEKGAFTGADQRKIGLVELASGGALFLDEIGELPLSLQPKLLRMIQQQEIQRVGGLKTLPVDVRLIAATNRRLEEAIAEGRFREDLFYRLNVINIALPPLRERRDDIPLLLEHFAASLGRRLKEKPIAISPDAVEAFRRYSWPGNVRELQNILERIIVLLEGETIELDDVPAEIRAATARPANADTDERQIALPPDAEYREALASFEQQFLTGLLEECGGNVSAAARRAGISRRNFYEKLEKLEISPKDYK